MRYMTQAKAWRFIGDRFAVEPRPLRSGYTRLGLCWAVRILWARRRISAATAHAMLHEIETHMLGDSANDWTPYLIAPLHAPRGDAIRAMLAYGMAEMLRR